MNVRKTLLSGSLALGALALAAPAASAETLVGSTEDNGEQKLVVFDSGRPDDTKSYRVQGLAPGYEITGLDVRPATGVLFADAKVGGDDTAGGARQLYTIKLDGRDGGESDDRRGGYDRGDRGRDGDGEGTATATPVGGSDSTAGRYFGFAFNPVVDRIRFIDDQDENRRYNPDNGARADTPPDGTLAFAAGDRNAGDNPVAVDAGYTNQQRPGGRAPTTTELYDIEVGNDVLVEQDPPNAGTLNTVGPLGVNVSEVGGYDIAVGQTGFAALLPKGQSRSRLYTVDEDSGRARDRGRIGVSNLVETLAEAPRGFDGDDDDRGDDRGYDRGDDRDRR